MKQTIFDDSYAVGAHCDWISDRDGWTDSVVFCADGAVSVYAQGDEEHLHLTRLDLLVGDRVVSRSIRGKRYTKRGLITAAKRFAAEYRDGCAA